jgi:hypothetical protein
MDAIKITKLDAARRQLKTAIRMWFADDDPVSIYALTYAAHEVLHTLHRGGGAKHGLVFDSSALNEAAQTSVTTGIRRWGNFFKHAKKDPNKEISFRPAITDLLLLASTDALRLLTKEVGAEEAAYTSWFAAKDPDAFERLENPTIHAMIRRDFQTKAEFWTYMRENWGTKIRIEGGRERSVRYGETKG